MSPISVEIAGEVVIDNEDLGYSKPRTFPVPGYAGESVRVENIHSSGGELYSVEQIATESPDEEPTQRIHVGETQGGKSVTIYIAEVPVVATYTPRG